MTNPHYILGTNNHIKRRYIRQKNAGSAKELHMRQKTFIGYKTERKQARPREHDHLRRSSTTVHWVTIVFLLNQSLLAAVLKPSWTKALRQEGSGPQVVWSEEGQAIDGTTADTGPRS